jgi:hypothetical protein
MMKMSGLVSPDEWVAFTLSVPGLVVSASSVSDWMPCLLLIGTQQEMVCFIEKNMSVEWLHLVGPRTMLRKGVDAGAKVDLNIIVRQHGSSALSLFFLGLVHG